MSNGFHATQYDITRNSIKCNRCGDEIESASVHDFRWCSCGTVAVDGGREYLKRLYKSPGDYEDTSIYTSEEVWTVI